MSWELDLLSEAIPSLHELLNRDKNRVTPQEEDSLPFDNTEKLWKKLKPALEEVETAIHNLKNNKSAGSDGIKDGQKPYLDYLPT
uniref:Uncharacterized protein n=1 Tax=Megaselia scalaris TaxID=36166 RepID=T1H5I0_MEGSC